MSKFLFSLMLAVFFFCAIFSCEKANNTTAGGSLKTDNVLRFDVNVSLTSLNPAEVEATGSTLVFPLLYSYLFVPNEKGELEPDLADKWSYDPTSFTWMIYLRDDARFHNKKSVTSKDVVHTFGLWLKNIRPSLLAFVEQIIPLSPTIISIKLKKHDPLFIRKIWDMEIIPIAGNNKINYYNLAVGSGPFKFKDRQNNQKVVLEANQDYYNNPPALDQIIFYYQPDKETSWTRLLAGKTDVAHEISPKNYEITKQYESRFYFNLYTLRYYSILLYNTFDPLFSDPKVRWALSYGIDRKYIVENILKGYGRIAKGPMGVDSPFHNPGVKPIPFDPQKSLSFLKEAGWTYDTKTRCLYKDGKPFEFTLLVFKENQIEKAVARYIQLCLNDIGIKVRLQALPFKKLKTRYYKNTAFQAVLTEFSGAYNNPEYIRPVWAAGPLNDSMAGSFEHSQVVRLFNKALDESDASKQRQIYYKIDALIASLQPGTFLFHKTAIDVMSKRFKLPSPFFLTHEGLYRLRHASLQQGLNKE